VPTTAEEDTARERLVRSGLAPSFDVERGYESDYGLGLLALVAGAALITLGAAGVATGLAQADARADHSTLAAIGATPGLRRTLAAAQAVAVAGLGTLLGVFAGLVPGLAFIGAIAGLEVAIPWLTLAEVLVGIPLIAGTCAWLFTRSRLPLERRAAA
jgi:putative ABC transport system permease protein